MNIPASEILSRKKIGLSKGRPVYAVALIGGLHMIVAIGNGVMETLGVASHAALARHISRKNDSEIVFNDLSKSEQIDPRHFGELLTKYEQLTNDFRNVK